MNTLALTVVTTLLAGNIFIVAAQIIVSGHDHFEDVSCFEEAERKCHQTHQPVFENTYPVADEMKEACKSILKVIHCEAKEGAKCGERIALLVDRLKSFFDDICDAESAIGEAYLANVDCLNRQVAAQRNCTNTLVRKVHEILGQNQDDGSITDACYSALIITKCEEIHYKMVCGETAAEIDNLPLNLYLQISNRDPCPDGVMMKDAQDFINEWI